MRGLSTRGLSMREDYPRGGLYIYERGLSTRGLSMREDYLRGGTVYERGLSTEDYL